jgi:hypothetical protein
LASERGGGGGGGGKFFPHIKRAKQIFRKDKRKDKLSRAGEGVSLLAALKTTALKTTALKIACARNLKA